jgi:pyridoxamine 5'-phosphate oxidase
MIKFINLNQDYPYLNFKKKYEEAIIKKQKNIEAISISSYSKKFNEVNSRYVNLKFVDNKEFIFFSNYNSSKSLEFIDHKQITALIYWNSINTQIRLKATIEKKSTKYNKSYFSKRSEKKNALAISSDQSKPIDSFENVIEKYNKSLKNDDLKKCPEYWGGFSFIPYYFEFWEGHKTRINKREVFDKTDGVWEQSFLQP